MQMFEETYDSEQDKSYLVLGWKDFLPWKRLQPKTIVWKQNVMWLQVDCFAFK